MRPIDADELLKGSCEYPSYDGYIEVVTVDRIDAAPTLDVAPVVHAYWEEGDGEWVEMLRDWYLKPTYICSNCNQEENRNTLYCPNCGAKMDLEEPNENC